MCAVDGALRNNGFSPPNSADFAERISCPHYSSGGDLLASSVTVSRGGYLEEYHTRVHIDYDITVVPPLRPV